MHYLKRKIDTWLDAWKRDPDRKPVLLKGARQVGKTEAVRHFAAKNYDSVVEINFALQPEFRQIVADGYRAESIFRRISALGPGSRFPRGRTLLFLDEIQEFPDIATSFKSLKAEGAGRGGGSFSGRVAAWRTSASGTGSARARRSPSSSCPSRGR